MIERIRCLLMFCCRSAGEALGAIGDSAVLDLLKEYSQDPVIEVRASIDSKPRYTHTLGCHAGLCENPERRRAL